jgi:hypothetical protein
MSHSLKRECLDDHRGPHVDNRKEDFHTENVFKVFPRAHIEIASRLANYKMCCPVSTHIAAQGLLLEIQMLTRNRTCPRPS